jgi:hypothetical protein
VRVKRSVEIRSRGVGRGCFVHYSCNSCSENENRVTRNDLSYELVPEQVLMEVALSVKLACIIIIHQEPG